MASLQFLWKRIGPLQNWGADVKNQKSSYGPLIINRSELILFFPIDFMTGSNPPKLSQQELHTLREAAIDYALANGLVVRPTTDKQIHFANNAAVTHAPFSLFPTPFPRREFEKAQKLQTIWNELIHRLSQDDAFLNEIMDTYVKYIVLKMQWGSQAH